jgi:hypothetical protein
VAFQHCGLTGDVRNCQTMVMLTYATAAGVRLSWSEIAGQAWSS